MIKGMADMGATFDKADDSFLYFTIKKGSEIDNENKLKIAKEAFNRIYGLSLKFKLND